MRREPCLYRAEHPLVRVFAYGPAWYVNKLGVIKQAFACASAFF